jgi:hypothetical protein
MKADLKSHPTDVLSLVFGLIFLAIVLWWAMDAVFGRHLAFGWLVAGSLIAIGGIGVYAAVRPGRASRKDT